MKVQRYLLIFVAAVILINVKWGASPLIAEARASFDESSGTSDPSQKLSIQKDRSKEIFAHLMKHLQGNRIAIPPTELQAIVTAVHDASTKYGFKPELLLSLIEKESMFKSKAVSAKGAVGLMQVLPSTAEIVAEELDIEWSGEHILYDPAANIEIGTYYLYTLWKRFQDIDTALSAYNVGPTKAVAIKGNAPFLQTYFSMSVKEHQVTHTLQ